MLIFTPLRDSFNSRLPSSSHFHFQAFTISDFYLTGLFHFSISCELRKVKAIFGDEMHLDELDKSENTSSARSSRRAPLVGKLINENEQVKNMFLAKWDMPLVKSCSK